jgi:hypothetical protein
MITREFKFGNGDVVKDKITELKGTITGTAFYITGCNQYLITAKAKDDYTEPIVKWCDEGRLDLIERAKVKEEDVKSEKDPGADLQAPIK